ncbi:MAG: YkvA family protein [Gammaproteobacteria bacterium]|nr:YkvA family protein [Gammaproteobacteria bacterium]MDH5302988.1 YkvA family protein [Gammaproteobacteria bacterium]MDH5321265.1 YkvA family protein [Gammaproteobacteria bacterium]
MSLRISFDLNEDDLRHFRLIMRAARDATERRAPEDIVAAAVELLHIVDDGHCPAFIAERLQKLDFMIRMISDLDWRLPHAAAKRVLHALAYFAEPDDLIPDHIPGLGYLDDAIMVELLMRELRHEIEAYRDFCAFRDAEQVRSEQCSRKERRARLNSRRESLLSRMQRRLKQDLKNNPAGVSRLLD